MTIVRVATTADARGLAEVRVRGWQVGYEGIVDGGFLASMSIDANEERWRAVIDGQRELQQTLVAVVDGRVVGFASIGPYRSETGDDKTLEAMVFAARGTIGELYGFYVHPDSWGSGVANELHDVAVGVLWRDGWTSLKLWVLEDNARARRFYERNRWSTDGARQALTLPGAPMELRYELLARS